MDAGAFHDGLTRRDAYRGQTAHVECIPARPARYGDVPDGVREAVRRALAQKGVERLYTHQAEAVRRVRGGEDVVVVTGTASGKTLCYDIPVVERMLAGEPSTALFVYPTKALAQDQLRGLAAFQLSLIHI